MEYIVYHLCRKKDKQNFNEGYIGITTNLKKCAWKHKNEPVSNLMERVFNQYTDLVMYEIKSFELQKQALSYKEQLRPINGLAWNIMKGGALSVKGVKRSEEHIKKIKDGSSKNFWIYFPDGTKKKINNLTKFCNDNNLNIQSVRKNKNGHKGFKAVPFGKQKEQKTFLVTNPLGEEIIVHFLTQFCSDNGLTKQRMYALAKGEGKTHKGWKCQEYKETE